MVDNFKIIEEYIAKQSLTWKEGDCYYVQLLRRQADDPMIGGVKDKKYLKEGIENYKKIYEECARRNKEANCRYPYDPR
jgi:hypothetical protein